ncbi:MULTISPECIES: hypothetical protein [Haloferax]|uniref:hypothetical protein n=1 Tax=Haloferax TaxID=2251 RepID=UPI00177EFAA5|nr:MULTISPECIES: hypothetical protein [Haloferax]
MNRVRTAGIATTGVAVVAYGVGTLIAYPGRAFSLTALMVGITLWAVGGVT